MQQQAANWDDAGAGETGLPAHELIYRRLREMILFGDLTPGQAVTIQGLTAELGAGMTPVREAIRRLTSQGALDFQGNRRVSVPLLKAGDIDEMIVAREWLDPYLIRRAALAVSADQVDHLAEIDTALDLAIRRGDLRAYLKGNYEFHMMLYALAASPLLAELAEGLWLRFGPSMRVVCGRMGTQNLPDNHKAAIEALRAADADAAAEAIGRDVRQGMEQLRLSLEPPVAAS